MTAKEVRPGRTGPVVLCSDGLGGTWPDWLPLADAVPAARVVAVVRDEVDLDAAAGQVAAALDAVGGESAVLVGHSMGGFVAEAAARLFPHRVTGLVLLDSSVTHVGPVTAALDIVTGGLLRNTSARLPAFADFAARIKHRLEPAVVRHDPERRAVLDPLDEGITRWRLIADELLAFRDWARRLDELRDTNPLGRIRVEVVTATGTRPVRYWQRQQAHLVDLLRREPFVSGVRHHTVRSGHFVHLEQAGAAAAAVRALL